MPKIIAIMQARTDSTRLPNKVLLPILNQEMILHQLQRISRSKKLTKLIVATSNQESDDRLVEVVQTHGYECFRGSKEDVLERFYRLCIDLNLQDDDMIVRLTADCPLHDPDIIDELIDFFIQKDVDYVANCIKPVYPDGFDAEIFTFKALACAFKKAKKTSEHEHVTPYIYNSGLFKTANLYKENSLNTLRLTVDEPKDFELITTIFEYFGDNYFTYDEIIRYISTHKELININAHIKRNEGYQKSLLEDNKET